MEWLIGLAIAVALALFVWARRRLPSSHALRENQDAHIASKPPNPDASAEPEVPARVPQGVPSGASAHIDATAFATSSAVWVPAAEQVEPTEPPSRPESFVPVSPEATIVDASAGPDSVAITSSPPGPEPLQVFEDQPKRRRRPKQRLKPKKNSRLLFFDVETTGLSSDDRIVSIGMLSILAGDLLYPGHGSDYQLQAQTIHLVFNPERPSNPFAQRVHGWPDEVLARQPRFSNHAPAIANMFAESDLWLAHNLAFDLRFLRQEFKRLGRPLSKRRTFCTMEHARKSWEGQTAKLDHCVSRIGLSRSGERHGALEDAVLCAALYTHYQIGKTFGAIPECGKPTNLIM